MAKSESDSMQYTLPLKQKQIEQSRLEAEARKEATIKNAEADAAAQVKSAEAAGQAKVIGTKADTERSRLLSESQNVLMVKNAEAAAQAKIIDSKAELEHRNLLADAQAHNIRVTSQAEAEQLQLEASALKTNPLLVQYTVLGEAARPGRYNQTLSSCACSGGLDQSRAGMVDQQEPFRLAPAAVLCESFASADPRGRRRTRRGLPQGVRRADAQREHREGAGLESRHPGLAAVNGGRQPQQQNDRHVALAGLDLGDIALGNPGPAGKLAP